MAELRQSGLVRKGFTPEVVETPPKSEDLTPDQADTLETGTPETQTPSEPPRRGGFRVIDGGKD